MLTVMKEIKCGLPNSKIFLMRHSYWGSNWGIYFSSDIYGFGTRNIILILFFLCCGSVMAHLINVITHPDIKNVE